MIKGNISHHGGERIYPADPARRASIDRWLDWLLATVIPHDIPVFWGTVRTPPEKQDKPAIAAALEKLSAAFGVLEAQLAGQPFLTGGRYVLADLILGIYAHRYLANPFTQRPDQPGLTAWYERMRALPVYKKHVDLDGFPVVSSDKVSDAALQEAAYLIEQMLAGRDDVRKAFDNLFKK